MTARPAKPKPPRRAARTTDTPRPLRVEMVPLDSLKPYAKNPRLHSPAQVKRIVLSMLEFGFTNPILIADGTVIAGHGRLAAARQLAYEHVPVIRLDHLTDVQRRAYLIADNRLAEDAEWDPALLAGELRALEAEAFDLGATGFGHEELEDLERAIRKAAAPAARRAGAARILHMLEFDTQEQKDTALEFLGWLASRANSSRGAALAAHATAAMASRGR